MAEMWRQHHWTRLHPVPPSDPHRWGLPERNDHRWLQTAQQHASLRSRFYMLNTTMSVLRPDLHLPGDCLHQ